MVRPLNLPHLVYHDLGTVGKVAKLGFPNGEAFGQHGAVAVFKAQGCIFAQQAVVNAKTGLFF
jgi:hypothetical protein